MIEEVLRKITVRIKNESSNLLGTGVMWFSDEDKQTMYIFTAGHVVYQEGSKFKIDCLFDGLEGEYIFQDSDITYHKKFEKIADKYIFDGAVISISMENEVNNYNYDLCYMENEINMVVKSYGFTRNSNSKKIIESGIPLSGKVISACDNETKKFQIELFNQLDQTERSQEIKGASGAALLIENGNYIEFLGFVSCGYGVNATNNIITCFSSILFLEILKENFSINMDKGLGIYSSFAPFAENVICDYENKTVKSIIKASIDNILNDKGVTPQFLIAQYDDCYNVPTCNAKTRYKCKTRWRNKLLLISLFNAMGIPKNDYQKPFIEIDDNTKIPIEFVCSEGHGDGVKMGGLVQSIDEKRSSGFNSLRGASTLIWSSQGVPNRKAITKEKYNGIVKDISKNPENIFKQMEVNIKEGNKERFSYSIIHIHKIQEEIDSLEEGCSLEDIVECVKEVVKSVN